MLVPPDPELVVSTDRWGLEPLAVRLTRDVLRQVASELLAAVHRVLHVLVAVGVEHQYRWRWQLRVLGEHQDLVLGRDVEVTGVEEVTSFHGVRRTEALVELP